MENFKDLEMEIVSFSKEYENTLGQLESILVYDRVAGRQDWQRLRLVFTKEVFHFEVRENKLLTRIIDIRTFNRECLEFCLNLTKKFE